MSTDPGELVVDPTCGSGTTAYVAEQWGRRSITIDTSRAGACPHAADGGALPLVSACHSCEGRAKEVALTRSVPAEKPVHNDIRQGFAYERVPHITFKSIADNTLSTTSGRSARRCLNRCALRSTARSARHTRNGRFRATWPPARRLGHTTARQTVGSAHRLAEGIDADIAARADVAYLYDRPYPDGGRVRVAGPFRVESVSPRRMRPGKRGRTGRRHRLPQEAGGKG
jgi:adenine-specific DNA-methyltransferase